MGGNSSPRGHEAVGEDVYAEPQLLSIPRYSCNQKGGGPLSPPPFLTLLFLQLQLSAFPLRLRDSAS